MGLTWLLICLGACASAVEWSFGREMSRSTWESSRLGDREWLIGMLGGGEGGGVGGAGYGDGDGDGNGGGSGYGGGDGSGYGYGSGNGDGDGDIVLIRHGGTELTGDLKVAALLLIADAMESEGVLGHGVDNG